MQEGTYKLEFEMLHIMKPLRLSILPHRIFFFLGIGRLQAAVLGLDFDML